MPMGKMRRSSLFRRICSAVPFYIHIHSYYYYNWTISGCVLAGNITTLEAQIVATLSCMCKVVVFQKQ